MLYLGIFGLEFEKAIVIFEINALKFVWLQSLVQKKFLNLGPKRPNLRISGVEFENINLMFQIRVLEFVLLQSLVQK